MNPILSTNDVALRLKVNESTVKRWTDKGTLRCYKTPGGHRKYLQKDVAEFIERYGFEAQPELHPAASVAGGIAISTDYALLTKNYEALASVLNETILRGDHDDTLQFFRLLRANRFTFVELCDNVISLSLRRIGSMWVERTVSIEQEHIATHCILSAIRLIHAEIPKKPHNHRIAIFGCFEGEYHEVGITCARNALDTEGWTTFYIGPNLPVDSFIRAVERYTPDLVCVSATTPKVKSKFHKECLELHRAAQEAGAKLIVGGSATMQGNTKKIAADHIPKNLADMLQWVASHVPAGTP